MPGYQGARNRALHPCSITSNLRVVGYALPVAALVVVVLDALEGMWAAVELPRYLAGPVPQTPNARLGFSTIIWSVCSSVTPVSCMMRSHLVGMYS